MSVCIVAYHIHTQFHSNNDLPEKKQHKHHDITTSFFAVQRHCCWGWCHSALDNGDHTTLSPGHLGTIENWDYKRNQLTTGFSTNPQPTKKRSWSNTLLHKHFAFTNKLLLKKNFYDKAAGGGLGGSLGGTASALAALVQLFPAYMWKLLSVPAKFKV